MAEDKHPGGRPEVDYTEHAELGWDYLKKYKDMGEVVPTVVGFAQFCRTSGYPVSRETVYARDEFSDIREQIKEIQERDLVSGGLNGGYHPRFTQFLLGSKHGYVERRANEHSGPDGRPLNLINMAPDDADPEADA
jgi:hypothetical protein